MVTLNPYHGKNEAAALRTSYLNGIHRFRFVIGDTTTERVAEMSGKTAKDINLALRREFVQDCMDHPEPLGRLSYWKMSKKNVIPAVL